MPPASSPGRDRLARLRAGTVLRPEPDGIDSLADPESSAEPAAPASPVEPESSAEPAGLDPPDEDEFVLPGARSHRAERRTPLGAALVSRGPLATLRRDWIPEPLRGARVNPGRRGAVALTLVAAVAAVVAAVGVWRSRPQPTPITPVALPSVLSDTALSGTALSGPALSRPDLSAGTGGSATAAAGFIGTVTVASGAIGSTGTPRPVTMAAGPAVIVVSVTGRVRRPGLVSLPTGSRVADAIAAAGGALDVGDLTGLNLATKLSDGASVVVGSGGGSTLVGGTAGGTAGTIGTSVAGGPLDLNTADVAALDALPGVGPVTAANIVAWRQQHGPFTSVDQLQAIPGIGPAKFAQLAPLVTVSSASGPSG